MSMAAPLAHRLYAMREPSGDQWPFQDAALSVDVRLTNNDKPSARTLWTSSPERKRIHCLVGRPDRVNVDAAGVRDGECIAPVGIGGPDITVGRPRDLGSVAGPGHIAINSGPFKQGRQTRPVGAHHEYVRAVREPYVGAIWSPGSSLGASGVDEQAPSASVGVHDPNLP